MLEFTSEATWTLNAFCGKIFVVTNVCLHVWPLDFYIFLITCEPLVSFKEFAHFVKVFKFIDIIFIFLKKYQLCCGLAHM